MSGTGSNGTGGFRQAEHAINFNRPDLTHNEVSAEILASHFKTDSTAARRAIEWIQSRREELASIVALRFPQLNDHAASHLLRDSNLLAAWDRVYDMTSTRVPTFDPVPGQNSIDHQHTGSSISFPIQTPDAGPARIGPHSDSGLNPHRPAVSNTNSVSGMARRHVECKRAGCKGKIIYKTKRGLREHMIMKHHMPEEQARIQAEFAFSDSRFGGTLRVPHIPGTPSFPAATLQDTDNQSMLQHPYWIEEVGSQFQPTTSPTITVAGNTLQQVDSYTPDTSNRSHLSLYAQQRNLPAAGSVMQARLILNEDLQNPDRMMQTSPNANTSMQMPNHDSQASFESFEPFSYTEIGEHTYDHDAPMSNFNRRSQQY